MLIMPQTDLLKKLELIELPLLLNRSLHLTHISLTFSAQIIYDLNNPLFLKRDAQIHLLFQLPENQVIYELDRLRLA